MRKQHYSLFSSKSTREEYTFEISDEQEEIKVLGPITVAEGIMFNDSPSTPNTSTNSAMTSTHTTSPTLSSPTDISQRRNPTHNKMLSLPPELYEDVSDDEDTGDILQEEYNLSDSQKRQLQNLEIQHEDEESGKKKDTEQNEHSFDKQTEKDFLLSQSIVSKKYFLLRRLGFPEFDDEEERKQELQWELKNKQKVEESLFHWANFYNSNGGVGKPITKSKTYLRTFVRKFMVPPKYRPRFWFDISGAKKKMVNNEGYYTSMLDVHKGFVSPAKNQIELDLSRTFPDHPFFKGESSEGRQKMRRVLTAFSWKNPSVSYCQSFNFIVGLLLLHFEEEQAFWMLVVILENILPENFYNIQLKGLRVEGKVLEDLIKERLPKIHNHFKNLNFEITTFISGWFMRLFIDIFPIETTLRIWDCLFTEGIKILHRVALAYLKLNEQSILQMDHIGEILHFLNNNTRFMYDHVLLTKTMWSFYKLKRKTIETLRSKYRPLIELEEKEIEQRRNQIRSKTKIEANVT